MEILVLLALLSYVGRVRLVILTSLLPRALTLALLMSSIAIGIATKWLLTPDLTHDHIADLGIDVSPQLVCELQVIISIETSMPLASKAVRRWLSESAPVLRHWWKSNPLGRTAAGAPRSFLITRFFSKTMASLFSKTLI